MKNKISIILIWLLFMMSPLLIEANAFADDVSIDSSGNVTTGVSNTNANLEVSGASAEDAIVGSTSGTGAAGVYGENSTSGNAGLLGDDNFGVYGTSVGGHAGYFQGNVGVTGDLTVDGNILSGETDPTVNSLAKTALSCFPGQLTKWNGSAWACSYDLDTQMTLTEWEVDNMVGNNGYLTSETDPTVNSLGKAALSCLNNQVAKWIGSAWECADDNAGGGGSYQGVSIVAKSGGDYTSPIDAMINIASWCGTPGSTNPCLVRIMPGVYDIGTGTLQMQSYIDIEGSGENATKITGNLVSSNSGVLSGANNSELRDLSVENTSGSSAVSIYINNASPVISDVTVIAVQGSSFSSYGVNIQGNSSPLMKNVTVNANFCAICNFGSNSAEIRNSELTGGTFSFSSAITPSYVALTKLNDPVDGVVTCAGVYDSSYTFHTSTCP